MPGRYGARCGATPIGPMPGPPPPCGIANVLCRLRWQTSAPIAAGLVRPDLRVHVRAVHVDLAAVLVDDGADLADAPPRTRRASRGTSPSAPPAHRDAALPPSPADRRRSMLPLPSQATTTTRNPAIAALAGLRAVRGDGISTMSRPASPRLAMIGADGHQAGKLSLRAGVRLQRHRGKPRDRGRAPPRARLKMCRVALRLRRPARTGASCENSRPAHRHHLRCRVQLHRARAQRDHRRVEPDVLPLEAAGCSASSVSRNDAC